MSQPSVIAIDGPAASGKSTVGKLLARKLGYSFADTGAMYRALTLEALTRGIKVDDEAELTRLANSTDIRIVPGNDSRVTVNGRDVTGEIYCDAVDKSVSLVSKVAVVREVLVERQRYLANGGGIIMVGRDIGTVVLPQAELKIYLDVSIEEQARRRQKDIVERGEKADYASILADLKRRDEIDSKREVGPLRPAEDAVRIDTDRLNAGGVVAEILRIMEKN